VVAIRPANKSKFTQVLGSIGSIPAVCPGSVLPTTFASKMLRTEKETLILLQI